MGIYQLVNSDSENLPRRWFSRFITTKNTLDSHANTNECFRKSSGTWHELKLQVSVRVVIETDFFGFLDSGFFRSPSHYEVYIVFFWGGVKRRHTQIPTARVCSWELNQDESLCHSNHLWLSGATKLYSAERRFQLDVFSPSMARVAHQGQFGRSEKGIAEEATGCCHKGFPTNQLSKFCKIKWCSIMIHDSHDFVHTLKPVDNL